MWITFDNCDHLDFELPYEQLQPIVEKNVGQHLCHNFDPDLVFGNAIVIIFIYFSLSIDHNEKQTNNNRQLLKVSRLQLLHRTIILNQNSFEEHSVLVLLWIFNDIKGSWEKMEKNACLCSNFSMLF